MKCKTRVIAYTTVLLLPLLCSRADAATVFNDDVTFVDGDVYWSVEIHGDAHAEVLGGHFSNRFQLYDDSTATITGGNFRGSFVAGGTSEASIYPGAYINTYISVSGSAKIDILGGRMPDRFLDIAVSESCPLVTFHGSNLAINPTGGSEGQGLVTGIFADGHAFSVNLRGAGASSCVRLAETNPVPEPTSLVLWLGMGTIGVIVVRSKQQRVA